MTIKQSPDRTALRHVPWPSRSARCLRRAAPCASFGLLLAALLVYSGCGRSTPGATSAPSTRGRDVDPEQLKTLLRGVTNANDTRAALVRALGDPDRDIGSGELIEQWDTTAGVLTLHPAAGPSFTSSTGDRVWLLETRNPVGENLLGDYEMCTHPEGVENRNRYYLGVLRLRLDGSYLYEDGGQNLGQRGGQGHNFFLQHRGGSFTCTYTHDVTPQTLLESVSDGRVVAVLDFASGDSTASARYSIVADTGARSLYFTSDSAVPVDLWRGWVNFWP